MYLNCPYCEPMKSISKNTHFATLFYIFTENLFPDMQDLDLCLFVQDFLDVWEEEICRDSQQNHTESAIPLGAGI